MTCTQEEQDRITYRHAMPHRTACGWSQVCIDSGLVRPCGPVPFAFAVTPSHDSKTSDADGTRTDAVFQFFFEYAAMGEQLLLLE